MFNAEILKNVEDFISDKSSATTTRSNIINALFAFVLDNEQFTSAEEKERENDGLESFSLNFCSDYIERYLARLFPKNQRTGVMEVGAKVYGDTAGNLVEVIIDAYRRNYLPSILIEQGTCFLVGGSACLYYPQNPITHKTDIISLDPRGCFLAWRGNKVLRFAHREKFSDGSEEIFYIDENSFITILKKSDGLVDMETKENQYKFIPISWIPCFPKPFSNEGRSKILQLYDLDIESNRQAANFSKRINDNTIPHTNVFSDVAKEGDYKRGKKKVSYFGKDDDVRQEEFKESPEVLDYLNFLNDKMQRKTGLVDIGGAIKASVSGVSLSFQFSEMMDLIGFMRIFWDKAFRELNQAILTYELKPGEYKTDPVYNPSLAFDSKTKTDEYILMLENKLISRKDAITELRAVEDPDRVIEEIIAEDRLFDYLKPKPDNNNFNNKKDNKLT